MASKCLVCARDHDSHEALLMHLDEVHGFKSEGSRAVSGELDRRRVQAMIDDPHEFILQDRIRQLTSDLTASQALAESRSLTLATMREALANADQALLAASNALAITGWTIEREQAMAAMCDAEPLVRAILDQPADDAAALAGAVLEAADAIVEMIVAEGNCKTARDLYRVAREQEHALDAYRRARAALRGDGAVEEGHA